MLKKNINAFVEAYTCTYKISTQFVLQNCTHPLFKLIDYHKVILQFIETQSTKKHN